MSLPICCTDETGRFDTGWIHARRYPVELIRDELTLTSVTLEVRAGQHTVQNLQLPEGAWVRISVVSDADGRPVADARVDIGDRTTRFSDTLGVCEVGPMQWTPPMQFRVHAEGFANFYGELPWSLRNGRASVVARLARLGSLTIHPRGQYTGLSLEMLCDTDGRPPLLWADHGHIDVDPVARFVHGDLVNFGETPDEVDDGGRALRWPHLPPATYRLRIDGGNGITARDVTIHAGEQADLGNIELGVAPDLVVRVVDDHGEPVAGVGIRALRRLVAASLQPSATSDETGIVRFAGMGAPGTVVVTTQLNWSPQDILPGFPAGPAVSATIPSGTTDATTVTFVRHDLNCTLSGRLTLHDGSPAVFRRLHLTFDDQLTEPIDSSTDADGHFELRRLPAGRGVLHVADSTTMMAFDMPLAGRLTRDMQLDARDEPAPVVSQRVRVVDTAGQPVPNARVTYERTPTSDLGHSFTADATGCLTYPHRVVGSRRMIVHAGDVAYPAVLSASDAGPVVRLYRPDELARVVVRITTRGESLPAFTRVDVWGERAQRISEHEFVAARVPPGRVTIRVFAPGCPVTLRDVDVRAPDEAVAIDLPDESSIRVRVERDTQRDDATWSITLVDTAATDASLVVQLSHLRIGATYRIGGLIEGRRYRATIDSGDGATKTVDVTAGDEAVCEVTLPAR
ncbi:MAG: hypothetical protein AB7K09_05550 [Planctomycetota bacterium]